VIWSKASERDLDQIYAYYLEQAPETAHKRITNILEAVGELVFADQWQVDEYDPKSRRIIVDNRFRVLYREIKDGILVVRVHPVKKDPQSMQTGK
jgi:plasmid stabilization system protein ParE